METLLTAMGVISIAVLAWFVWGWLWGMVRGRKKSAPRKTDNVQKDIY